MSALLTEQYLAEKAQKGNQQDFLAAMAKVPDNPPALHDQCD